MRFPERSREYQVAAGIYPVLKNESGGVLITGREIIQNFFSVKFQIQRDNKFPGILKQQTFQLFCPMFFSPDYVQIEIPEQIFTVFIHHKKTGSVSGGIFKNNFSHGGILQRYREKYKKKKYEMSPPSKKQDRDANFRNKVL